MPTPVDRVTRTSDNPAARARLDILGYPTPRPGTRSLENEIATLGQQPGMEIVVWSPMRVGLEKVTHEVGPARPSLLSTG